jgi:hypothetical protein
MALDNEEFKFPDEVQVNTKEEKVDFEIEDNATEVEVVDDTPEADRGRAPMKEPPAEVTDDELAKYSEGVKQRIQHFSKGYHEERRAKESALREREEALRLAQNLMEENKKLQGTLGQGQQALLEQAKQTASAEVTAAKQKLKEAHEAFDTDGIVAAQEELAKAVNKSERLNSFKPPAAPVQPQQNAVQTPPTPQVEPKARAWQEANPWFGSNKRMTGFALAVHQELVESGVDTASDDYYARINAEVRKVFPEAFPSAKPAKTASVVAPATRSTAPKKIVLTQTQVNLAKRLGLTAEQYARAVADQMRKDNG